LRVKQAHFFFSFFLLLFSFLENIKKKKERKEIKSSLNGVFELSERRLDLFVQLPKLRSDLFFSVRGFVKLLG